MIRIAITAQAFAAIAATLPLGSVGCENARTERSGVYLWLEEASHGRAADMMSSKVVKNELRKLSATFFNTIGAGCVLLGLIGPMTAGKIYPGLRSEIGMWVLAVLFHLIARFQLWHLEE